MRVEPGHIVIAGLFAVALVADGVLITQGREPISTTVRRSPRLRAATAALAFHLLTEARHDPLHALGELLRRRIPGD